MIFEKFESHEVSQFSIFEIPNPFQVSYDLKPLFLKKDMFFSGSLEQSLARWRRIKIDVWIIWISVTQSWYTKSLPSSGVSGDNASMTTGMGPRRVGRVEPVAVLENTSFTARNRVVCFMMSEWWGQRPERWTASNVVRWSWTLLWRNMCVGGSIRLFSNRLVHSWSPGRRPRMRAMRFSAVGWRNFTFVTLWLGKKSGAEIANSKGQKNANGWVKIRDVILVSCDRKPWDSKVYFLNGWFQLSTLNFHCEAN